MKINRIKLTYKERIDWFVSNHCKTGMEHQFMYDSFKNEDLNKLKWYNDVVSVHKYKDKLNNKQL